MEIVYGNYVRKSDGLPHRQSGKPRDGGGNSGSPGGGDKTEADTFCSICLEALGDRTCVTLHCGHRFHLDCIGSAFNRKQRMECPICRNVERGEWLYACPLDQDDFDPREIEYVPQDDVDMPEIQWGNYVPPPGGLDPVATFPNWFAAPPVQRFGPIVTNQRFDFDYIIRLIAESSNRGGGNVGGGRNISDVGGLNPVEAFCEPTRYPLPPVPELSLGLGVGATGRSLAPAVGSHVAAHGRNLAGPIGPPVSAPGWNLPDPVVTYPEPSWYPLPSVPDQSPIGTPVAPPGGNIGEIGSAGVAASGQNLGPPVAAQIRTLGPIGTGVAAPRRNLSPIGSRGTRNVSTVGPRNSWTVTAAGPRGDAPGGNISQAGPGAAANESFFQHMLNRDDLERGERGESSNDGARRGRGGRNSGGGRGGGRNRCGGSFQWQPRGPV